MLPSREASRPSTTSLNRIERFRSTFVSASLSRSIGNVQQPELVDLSQQIDLGRSAEIIATPTRLTSHCHQRRTPTRNRRFVALIVLMGMGGFTLLLCTHWAGNSITVSSSQPVSSGDRKEGPNLEADFRESSSDDSDLELSTIDRMAKAAGSPSAVDAAKSDSRDGLSLDALVPPESLVPAVAPRQPAAADPLDEPQQPDHGPDGTMAFDSPKLENAGNELDIAGNESNERVPPSSQLESERNGRNGNGEDGELEAVTPTVALSGGLPAESPQATRPSSVNAVRLPDQEDSTTITRIADSPWKAPRLEFPIEVPLEIQGVASPWEVRDTRNQLLVATISSESDATLLKRSDRSSGEGSAYASSLAHGRIIDQQGGTVFLRPEIVSEPWPIRLDRSDVMPTWDLGQPIPPRVSRLTIALDLPEQIEARWSEAIDPQAIRRGRGVVSLVPDDGESVELAIRFDFRCNRKLSVRVRYAARIDASMPWQYVSSPGLEEFADQLIRRAEIVRREAERLSGVYDRAGSSGRRILRAKQKRNDALADTIRTGSRACRRTAIDDCVARIGSLPAGSRMGPMARHRANAADNVPAESAFEVTGCAPSF